MYFAGMSRSVLFFCLLSLSAFAQTTQDEIMHGRLTHERSAFDVQSYDIRMRVFPETKSTQTDVLIQLICLEKSARIQLDLDQRFTIDSLFFDSALCRYRRTGNTLFVLPIKHCLPGKRLTIHVYYHGVPQEAKKAPWDGGFVWNKDAHGRHWIGLACEGNGASLWLACKDHLSDEASYVRMRLQVPYDLVAVSNGRLTAVQKLDTAWTEYTWETHSTINNYNITVNIGDYVHLNDLYKSKYHDIDLDYYVLNGHQDSAQAHFIQVKKMLSCYENHFGPYAFSRDGYKLVETSYWGMEHQSCVSYGNHFKNNAWGFDFIIIHESAHEWFGNSISCSDPADMWIHESFTTYAESVFMECVYGKEKALEYLISQKPNIANKSPMIGPYGVYFHGRTDNDIYYKGAWILHSMRCILNNDTLWFNSLRDFCIHFREQITDTKAVCSYFSQRTRHDFTAFFKTYLYHADLPVLEYKIIENAVSGLEVKYRLKVPVYGLDLPITMSIKKGDKETVLVDHRWQIAPLNYFDKNLFTIQDNEVLFRVKEIK